MFAANSSYSAKPEYTDVTRSYKVLSLMMMYVLMANVVDCYAVVVQQ